MGSKSEADGEERHGANRNQVIRLNLGDEGKEA